jgi:type II secretory pathway component PulF
MSAIDILAIPFAKAFFGRKGRQRIYEQLAAMVEGGLKLDNALDALWDRASDRGRRPTNVDAIVLDCWRKEFRKAASLSDAVADWVPTQDRMLIEAGELANDLPTALREVAFLNDSVAAMRGALLGNLIYPTILLAAIVGAIYLFGQMVIPQFARVLPVENWTGTAATMADLAAFSQAWLFPSIGLLLVSMVTIVMTLPVWSGHVRARFDKLPPWSFYRLFHGVSFMLALSALLRAGVHTPVAMAKLRDTARPWMRRRISAALHHVNDGATLGDALDRTGFDFPDKDLVADLRIYAQMSGVETALGRLGRRWVEEGRQRINAGASMLRTVMMLAFTATIGWLYWGLFDLYQLMQAAASV